MKDILILEKKSSVYVEFFEKQTQNYAICTE